MIVNMMMRAMYEHDGAGLAATQIGIEQQIFVADAGEGPFAVINPEILKKSSDEIIAEEGCLSLPKIRVNVKRPAKISVRYLDENGRKVERSLTDLLARIFQHESDHLFGRMIVDYASNEEKKKYKDQLAHLEKLAKKNSKA